jgi:hypothetical protein
MRKFLSNGMKSSPPEKASLPVQVHLAITLLVKNRKNIKPERGKQGREVGKR